MYEQSLDMDSFHAYMNQHTEPRFYDDFFSLAVSPSEWKPMKRLAALPTPPSTPDKHPKFQFNIENQINAYQHHSTTTGLQVVPDTYCDEQQPPQHDYYNWYQDTTSEKFFNKQQEHIPSPIEQRLSPHVSAHQNVPYPLPNNIQDVRCSTTRLNLNNISDCVLSPVSPHPNNLKRSYPFNNNNESYPNNNNNNNAYNMMPSPNHVISPVSRQFANEFMISNAGMHSSQENYYKQLAFEKMRAQHKVVEDLEAPQPETELSRATHNVLERQRRNDLKLRFNILRDNIPELANNDKAPKIQILKKALEHLAELKSQEQELLVDVELEKQRKIILLNRLKSLQ